VTKGNFVRFAKPWVLNGRIGIAKLPLLEQLFELCRRWLRFHLGDERRHVDGESLDRRPPIQTIEIVPQLSRRDGEQTSVGQRSHVLGPQFKGQMLKELEDGELRRVANRLLGEVAPVGFVQFSRTEVPQEVLNSVLIHDQAMPAT